MTDPPQPCGLPARLASVTTADIEMTRSKRLLAGGALLCLALACARERPTPQSQPTAGTPPPEGTPRLVLLLIVDQCRADYLERFRPLLTHGFDRLLRESVVFTNTHHDHASTKTAPGHATLGTGAHPSRHGIISNSWRDLGSGEWIDSDDDDRWTRDKSPHRLLVPTLSDRLKELWPESKAFGASGKSRGAILPVGRNADGAFWFDDDFETGHYVTSTYYGETPPAWLEAFNERELPNQAFGTLWEPLPEVVERGAEFGIEALDRGLVYEQLPRAIGRATLHPNEAFYYFFYRSPFSDGYLGELAKTVIVEEELGADAFPDTLALSFSALDLVGHSYGPDSPEVLDTLLRLDQTLGELLDFIDERIGLENTLVTLSADHGVVPVPEVNDGGHRFAHEENICFQRVPRRLREELGEADWFRYDLVVDEEVAAAQGVPVADVEAAARRLIEACPGVERVFTSTELTRAPTGDAMEQLFRNSHYAGRSPNLEVQILAGSVGATSATTTHGSPYPYDTRVPWLLRTPDGAGRTVEERVATVDVVPTLAGLLGIEMTAELDGIDRLDSANSSP